eukprot:1098811-Ditylum_brightwellii.AAC.1
MKPASAKHLSPRQKTNSFIALQGTIEDEENEEDNTDTNRSTEAAKRNKANSKAKRETGGSGNNKAKKANLGTAIDIPMDELETNHKQENEQAGFAMQEEGTVMERNQEEPEEPEYDSEWEDALEAEEEKTEVEQAAAKTKHTQMIEEDKNTPNKQQKKVK